MIRSGTKDLHSVRSYKLNRKTITPCIQNHLSENHFFFNSCLTVSSADNLCKQFGLKIRPEKMIWIQTDTLIAFLIAKHEQTTKDMEPYPACKEVNPLTVG